MKMHLSFNTRDLAGSVAFYRTLLAAEPLKHYSDYALFVLEDPAVELALNAAAPAAHEPGTHYGVAVAEQEEVDAATARLQRAGYPVDIESDEVCCYALQTKVWATDPEGRRWETYVVEAESLERDGASNDCCAAETTGSRT